MEEHKPRNAFDIPKVFYFKAGNIHTGTRDAYSVTHQSRSGGKTSAKRSFRSAAVPRAAPNTPSPRRAFSKCSTSYKQNMISK